MPPFQRGMFPEERPAQTSASSTESPPAQPLAPPRPRRSAFWLSFWLAVILVAAKAAHLGLPHNFTLNELTRCQRTLAIAVHEDILYAIALGFLGQFLLSTTSRRRKLQMIIWLALFALFVLSAWYGVVNLYMLDYIGAPMTYAMMQIGGSMEHMWSSVVHFATPWRLGWMFAAPLLFIALVLISPRLMRESAVRGWKLRTIQVVLGVLLLAFLLFARRAANARDWLTRADRLVAINPHWLFWYSCFADLTASRAVYLSGPVPVEYVADFQLAGERAPAPHDKSLFAEILPAGAQRPRNVITIVIESCPVQAMSLYGSRYKTTPRLDEEAKHATVFDNVYCHQGLTANSLVSIALSIYPPTTGWPVTSQQPDLRGTTLAQLLGQRGYRTAFISAGNNQYLTQGTFLANRGFDDIWDCSALERELGCRRIFSWGVEDRCLIDGVLKWIDRDAGNRKPFCILAWTQQTHHPYQVAPGAAEIDFLGDEKLRDARDYNRYLNCLHAADEQIGRLLDELRKRRLTDDTLVLVTGDHGEAFGTPHPVWSHGTQVYEECAHVPLLAWNPRLFPVGHRIARVGGLVDLNPTIVDLIGAGTNPPQWQGQSLFDSTHPDRAYFFSRLGDYLLAVRQGHWKYTYNATIGRETLFDLDTDPQEKFDVAMDHPAQCAVFRQRLTAWIQHEDQHYAELINSAKR